MSSQKVPIVFPPALAANYTLIRELGAGAYGIVSSAKHNESGKDVAIKKVQKVFEKSILAKRALREIKLLRHFNCHENITAILDMDVIDYNSFNEVYLVQELMEADLHQIIRSGQNLTDAHFQYFIYQICRGLKFIHSANVLHRDLKPGNLLVNADCELKICDFGLARGLSDSTAGFMTEYVATRWYRAPEIMLSFKSYTKAIDMWSVGCIFAELLSAKPLFKGKDYVDQLNQILRILGTPEDSTMRRIGSDRAQVYIRSLPKMKKVPWESLFPTASVEAIDLLEKLLKFDPYARITVEQALEHRYVASYHDPADEPTHPHLFDFAFESVETIDEMKYMIAQEIIQFKAGTNANTKSLNLQKTKEAMTGPTRSNVGHIEEDIDDYDMNAMDIDEELRIKEATL